VKPTWEELFPNSSPQKKPTFDEVMSTPKTNVTSLPEIRASGPSRIKVGRIEVESSPSKPTLQPTQRTPYAQQRFNFQVSAPKLDPTPQKTELPAEYLTDDSTLTPQQVIEKYRKIAQDTTLSKKEREKLIKQGKDVLGNILQANNKLKTFGYKPLYENVTPEESKQAQDVYSLLQTRTAGAAVMANALDSLTFGFGAKAFDSVNDKILEKAKEAGVDVPDAPTLTQITQQSKEEHPVASAAGQLIGRAPIYQGLGAALGKVPAYAALQSGKLPARLAAGRIIDVVPDALDAISQKDNTADRIKQFAINQATGLVFDTALEGLGAAVKAGTKKLRPNDVAETAAKSVDTPTLKPAEAPTIKPEAPSLKPTETPTLKPKGFDDMKPDKAIETPLQANAGAQVPDNAMGGIKPYSAHEAANLSSRKGVVNGKDMSFSEFIAKSKAGKDSQKFYFGKVSDELAQRIKDATGASVDGYNIVIRSDEVRHILSKHGDPAAEAAKGQIAVNEGFLATLPRVFDNPDEIVQLSSKDYAGRNAFELRKKINGYAIVINGVSDGKKSIAINSYWILNTKKPPATFDVAKTPPELTPKASSRPASINSVSDSTAKINIPDSQSKAQPFGKNTVGAAERNLASYDAMQNMYGTIKPGELPHGREVDVPKSTDGTDKVRQYARTVMEAPATPDSLIKDFEDAVAAGEFSYKPKRDKDALDMAVKTITDKGYDGALKQWKDIIDGNRAATKEDMVLGQLLYAEAAKAGDTKLAMELAAEIAAEGTKLGQGIQALRLLKKMTPEGRLYYAQKMVDHLNKDLADQLKGQKIEIDHDLAQRLLKASSMEEADQISDLIMKHVAEQVPATWLDKWNAWRYLSMLGNPRTHIRNLLGNAIFVPARKIKNMIGAGIESGTNAVLKPLGKSIDRTKAILTSADKPLKEFAKSDFIKMKDIVTAGGKLNPSDIIQENRKIFDNKALEAIRKFNTTALEWEDGLFLKGAYAESMAQYMKANKLTPEFLNSGTQEAKAALKKARDYAILEAQKATYRDASKVADVLNKLKKTNAVTNVIGEGLVPFTKTPINIVKRGYEYSPLRFIQTLTWDLSKLKAGEKTAAEVIDGIASGLTGTGIIALGAWMASKGLVTGGNLENKKEDEFSELQGEQHYALKIGDSSYTIDWTAPVSLPFFIGVELFNQANGEHPEVGIERILDSMTSISEPMINMSMLQGLNNAIKTAGYSESPLTSGMVSTAIGYMGQAVPTLLGQVARSIDPIRRTTFTETGSPNQDIQRQVQKAQAKIPFASQKLQPYVDQWGRTQENIGGSFLGRLAFNTLSPGYYSRIRSTPLDQELGRLQQAESNTSVLPSKPQKYFTVGGERKNLNAKEYTEYARAKGNLSYEIADKIRLNPAYNQLSDQEKAGVIEDVYKYADALARKQIAPDYKLDAWIEKAQNSPVPIDEYIIQRNRYNNLEPVKDKNGKTIESAADAYRKYLLSNMDLTAEEKAALDRDFTGAKNVPDYSSKDAYYLSQLTEKQRERYEKFNHGLLTAEAYYEVVKAAGKGGTKQEKIKLIEAIGYSPQEARQIYARILSK
jgi:hypothetical protein